MVSKDILDTYEMTIGIECHVQLATKTKLFSRANNDARSAEPNTNLVPIDYGLPGMLPVLNWEAVRLAVRAGKALGSEVALESHFDRKHYFYPDLPKGYQTTQMYRPIIGSGKISVPVEGGETIDVRIHHAHMEEDAGKLTHYDTYSLVDLNRAGTPLIEIVSEPDIHSAAAARAYATELHLLMTYAEVTRGDLYHGNMRFDVNISVAKKGAPLGTRAEIKNLNSFRSVERAAEYEFTRQVELLEQGDSIVQETRGWDDEKQLTISQRSKEDAQDYRYMPDPDIPPIVLTNDEVESIQADMPALPQAYRASWKDLKIDSSVVNTLLSVRRHAELVHAVQLRAGDEAAVRIANLFASGLGSNTAGEQVAAMHEEVSAEELIVLAEMVQKSEVSSNGAKEIFMALYLGEHDPRAIATAKSLLQNSDTDAIAAVVDEVLADPASAKVVADIRSGNDKAIGYLVGQVMKKSGGQANPSLAQQLLRERL